jgi:carbamoyl-phosphate synthase large subunit
MNVLVTSAARKVWLVEAFQRAVAPEGGRVFAADLDPLAATLRVADGTVALPRMDAPDFEARLLEACRRHDIGLLVPTRDAELPYFAARRAELAAAGVVVHVGPPETVRLCQDKRAFVTHCLAAGLAVPHTFATADEARGHVAFARPRTGAGGRGVARIDDAAALAALSPWDAWVVQTFVSAPEYTLDLLADLTGQVVSVVPRQRLRVVSGESVVGRTVEAPILVDRAVALSESLGLVGHNTLQCFFADAEPLWIEVNPRFGGGAALGFAAGVDTPRLLVEWLQGAPVVPRLGQYERGLTMYRYSTDLYVRGEA